MKLNPAEKQIYTIMAEREEMSLDEWLACLPARELARFEVGEPDEHQDMMLEFAKRMIANPFGSPKTSVEYENNWRICPGCEKRKYASAFPGGAEICRACAFAGKAAPAKDEPDPSPPVDDARYKTCERCGERKYMTKFVAKTEICKSCYEDAGDGGKREEISAEADEEAEAEGGQVGEGPGQSSKKVVASLGVVTKKCVRCEQVKPAGEFSEVARDCCIDCMNVAKRQARLDIKQRRMRA